MTRVLVLDNVDSFVYNLVQYLGELGAEPLVRRPGEVGVADLAGLDPDGLLISPGPGRPEDATVAADLLAACAGRLPVLGVCLGHQVMATAYGAVVGRFPVMHGKTSTIAHDGRGVFAGLPDPLVATRYHSLAVVTAPDGSLVAARAGGSGRVTDPPGPDPAALLEVTAWAEDGTVMGLRHRTLDVEGVQFHPESILTGGGHHLLANWLVRCGLDAAPGAVGPAAERLRLPTTA